MKQTLHNKEALVLQMSVLHVVYHFMNTCDSAGHKAAVRGKKKVSE